MERTIFLQHYRVSVSSDGAPNELGRDGAVVAYDAMDVRSNEPVALTLVPVGSIDPSVREHFEEQARAVQRLRHVNIAKVFDFGREGENYVYVSERVPGETLAAWVTQHGPMPPDATLRVAEQIVSVLSSAGFHKLPYPPIEPAYILVVPGQTPEGGWPLVKLTNFGLAGLGTDPEQATTADGSLGRESNELDAKATTSQELPPKAQSGGDDSKKSTRDPGLHTEIYSLGAIMYFLVTGIALSPEMVRQGPKFSGFPKPLRNLLSLMLHPDPDRRPKDLIVLGEMIRGCLLKIERRLALADRYGIPFRTTIRRPTQPRPRRLLRTALAFGALVVAAAVIAAVLFPESISTVLHRPRARESMGVLVGVPEPSPTPPAVQTASTPVAPATVLSEAANAALAVANQPATNGDAVPNSSQAPSSASPDLQQAQASNVQPQAVTTPSAAAAAPAGSVPETLSGSEASPKAPQAAQPNATDQSSSHGKKGVASTSSTRRGSMRVRMVGITSDGRLIYRLPSGRTRIVAPDSGEDQFAPRRRRRVPIQRDEMFAPPPQFGPDFPYD
jgi:serine/threonine protein kinase